MRVRINEAGAEDEVGGPSVALRAMEGRWRGTEINRVMGFGSREIADGRDHIAHYADICGEGLRPGAINDPGMTYNQVEHTDDLFRSTPGSVDDSGDENGLRGIQSSTVIVAVLVHRSLTLRKI